MSQPEETGSMIPSEVKAAHRALSERSETLLRLLETRPDFRKTSRIESAELPRWFREQYRMQAWPLFVESPRLEELRRAPVLLTNLIKSVPERIFEGDAEAIARFYGVGNELLIAAILEEPSGISSAIARGDFMDTEDGLLCLELNMSSCLGGWQIRFFADQLLRQPWMEKLMGDERRAVLTDPLDELFSHIVDRALVADLAVDGEVSTAFLVQAPTGDVLDNPMVRAVSAVYRELLASRYPDLRGDLLFAGYDGVQERHGGIAVAGRRVQAIVEYHGPATHPKIFRSFKAGRVHLYNGPAALLLRDKRNLALLSEHQESDRFTEREREVIRRHVPWTRITRPGSALWRGERLSLLELALDRREALVIKPAVGSRGDSVLIGDATPPEVWERTVREGFRSEMWVLQERLRSRPYWYRGDRSQPEPHDVIWGLFAFGDSFGGGYLRVMPKASGGVVSNALGASLGVFLEIH